MNRYIIIFYVPSFGDDFDEKIDKYLRNKPYKHYFDGTGVTPFRVITVENLSEQLVEKVKKDFFEMYSDHPKKETFKYQVMSQQGYSV